MLMFLLILKGFEFGNIRDGEERSLVVGFNCLHEVMVYGMEECLLKGAIGYSYRKISFQVAFIRMCIGLVLF